ncbi:MAG: DUF4340 domain-containing protein [Pseudomonadota bacterium]
MKRAQLNAALAAVAVGLAVAVFFSQEKEEKGPPLTALGSNGLTRIAIEHPGAPVIRLEKKDERWQMTAPVNAVVDSYEINGLLGLSELPTQSKIDLAQVQLRALELDPPQYRITLNDTVLEFGGVEPLKYYRYIKTGDAIYLVDDPPSAALDKDYADLVSKNLIPEGAEIVKVEAPKLSVNKDTKDSAGLLASWKNAKSMWNERAPDTVRHKGDAVTVTLKDRALKFVVVERDPQFKLHSPEVGINYVLSKALENELLKLPEPSKAEEKKEEKK